MDNKTYDFKEPFINIQEAHDLYMQEGVYVTKDSIISIKPPYNKCVLLFKHVENQITILRIDTIEENRISIRAQGVIDDENTLIDIFHGDIGLNDTVANLAILNSENRKYADFCMLVLLFALNLMNCKNIEYVPCDPNEKRTRKQRKQQSKHKFKYIEYDILEIQPMRKCYAQNLNPDACNDKNVQKILHTVRGHFKTYTSNKPLLGKYIGTYWWGNCIRGNLDAGVKEKDYVIHLNANLFNAQSN